MRSGMKTQGPFQLDSPAKVTLHLRILRRLRDGYHAVRIAQAPVSLCDTLHLELGGAPGIALEVHAAEPLGDPAANLVTHAARAYEAALGRPLAARVRLEKRIPAGAGLGGGSGNAAAMLVALERRHGHALGEERLAALARELGADVPFFLAARPAWAEGIGERVHVLPALAPLTLLVIKPPLTLSTAEAYRLARAEADGGPRPAAEPDFRSVAGIVAGLHNAFEAALLPRHPLLAELKAALLGAGALGASLSGSGSAVYGIFADARTRDAAAAVLAPRAAAQGWRLLPCRTLAAHRYDFVF
jgi:4-diphosphocytidyl-2-C-methyl-D-erythritol kinase